MELPARVVLASDHAGFVLKEVIKKHCTEKGIDCIDVGTFSEESIDYPAIMREGAGAAKEHDAPLFVFGGSGNGEQMAVNKVQGMRCALCYDEETARLARSHNNANAISMGGRLIDHTLATKVADVFLTTDFDGGRHERRINDLESDTLGV